MRKHTARHWLHAALDLLPIILIPVFMIYSHRHSMTTQTTVDIQYKYETNDVNNYNDVITGNVYYWNYTLDNDSGYDYTGFDITILKDIQLLV